MPFRKYRPFAPIDLPGRQWPGRTLDRAPRWCSVDLRDGNQALIDPMNVQEKLRMFDLLLEVGFAEIEVGFPAASQPDFDFIRRIIDERRIPEGVAIQVLCQAREELIERTVEALAGAPNVIFHLYNSTSELQRRVVFGMNRQGIIDLAVKGVALVKAGLAGLDADVTFEYSPESFTGTELDFAVDICTAVAEQWDATAEKPMIVNLPSTVEMATPNVYADQIEWFATHFPHLDRAVISLHTHNDRGTGIAATELALLAGAERVEGTLFGNGERTGNCDIVTMAMNLFSQGVDPELDFRNMPRIRKTVEAINKLPVHERHPYAGDLVFTAFSGSHQDAIKKGMAQVDPDHWEVPYLPIDPADVGSSYKETVRVNSQSGKGGVGFLLEEFYGIALPREMLKEFSGIVQKLTETLDREVKVQEIHQALLDEYAVEGGPYRLVDFDVLTGHRAEQRCVARIEASEQLVTIDGEGGGPIEAFVHGLEKTFNEPVNIVEYHEHALTTGSDAQAICLLAIEDADGGRCYGAGVSRNTITASFNGVIAALNRRWRAG
ncbi:MAG: 2-isopropylmalate synthase [Gammaproteobacteria bacterium]|nr:2-isopropylmalate synthase [Gammaproteobacteria bacterium]MCY4343126.1 2-isopropylmalate synthase [Gammaproteobacteria bacterium]